jgi:hypothetical protein
MTEPYVSGGGVMREKISNDAIPTCVGVLYYYEGIRTSDNGALSGLCFLWRRE